MELKPEFETIIIFWNVNDVYLKILEFEFPIYVARIICSRILLNKGVPTTASKRFTRWMAVHLANTLLKIW